MPSTHLQKQPPMLSFKTSPLSLFRSTPVNALCKVSAFGAQCSFVPRPRRRKAAIPLLTCLLLLLSLSIGESQNSISHPIGNQEAVPFFSMKYALLPDSKPAIQKPDTAQNWWATVQQQIAAMEYEVSFDTAVGKYQSPNRRQNIHSYYQPGQWQLHNLADSTGHNWQLGISTLGIFADGQPLAMPNDKPVAKSSSGQFTFEYPQFAEQYENNEQGVRQNFIINTAPAHAKTLEVKLGISGMEASQPQPGELLLTGSGTSLSYSGLKAWDANGKTIPCSMKLAADGRQLCLAANVQDAVFPVTIDPIIANGTRANANATLKCDQTDLLFYACAVNSAGDVNGDGYGDIIVGAFLYNNGQANEGAAFIYHGSAQGTITTYATRLEANQVNGQFGSSAAGAGDVNGDGYGDVIVGASTYDNGEMNEGAAFIYYGSASGIIATPAAMLESNQAVAGMGLSATGVAEAGDVNGDGYSDVVVGAPSYDDGQANEGVAFVYHGSATGINTSYATKLQIDQAESQFGWDVARAGDVNGDGYADILVGAYNYDNGETNEGAAFVYYGSASGIVASPTILEGNQANAHFGYAVAGAGDVNGDGYADIILGSSYYDNGETNEGAVFVYQGSASGIGASPAALLEMNQAEANFGDSVAGAGDVNGDGYADIIVGAIWYKTVFINEGAAFVYHGSASGIGTSPVARLRTNWSGGLVTGAGGVGDVNGDGYSDIIMASYNMSPATNFRGAVYVYHGSASGMSGTQAAMVQGDGSTTWPGWDFGVSVASAGDVNGDGYGDLVVGAQFYSQSYVQQGLAFIYLGSVTGISTVYSNKLRNPTSLSKRFDCSVDAAGDVNGDGYGDVVIGAMSFGGSRGAVHVFYGSASGISPTFSNIHGNADGSYLGCSVAGAGDVNGDGYDDIVAGAELYPNYEYKGAVFVYLGSATGITTTYATLLEGSQANACFGNCVAGAGDVNGDGYTDIIVGAYNYDNGETDEGAVYIYHGSAGGIGTAYALMLEGNQQSAWLGYSVSGAGDVNGDGYDDVVIGAYRYDNGETNEGVAFVYHGSATGISSTYSTVLECNQAGAWFGYSVAGAGDVNGDGYADIIVGSGSYDNGETDEGAAFIYHGSASGIGTAYATLLEANASNRKFGYAVASAGDVNGDGYDDVVVGAPNYYTVQPDGGAAFVYHGNGGGGLYRNLRLFNTGTNTPIQQANSIDPQFAIGVFAKSPAGRGKARLVWETRREGQPFSGGTSITTSTASTAGQGAYTNLGTTGTFLTANVDKLGLLQTWTKLRARIQYDPVSNGGIQVYGPWLYPTTYFSTKGMQGMPILTAQLLPLQPVHLTAQKDGPARNRLGWQPATTADSKTSYAIERSADGSRFATIGSQTGNSSGTGYTFYDDAPLAGSNYYRLRIKNTDGGDLYSNLVLVRNSGPDGGSVTVAPIPTRHSLTITNNDASQNGGTAILYNMQGVEMKRFILSASQTINVSGWAAGVYMLKLPGGESIKLLKE